MISGIFAVAAPVFSKNISQRIAKLWGVLILRACRIKVNITGSENLSTEDFYIITSNHQSYFDIFILLAGLNINFKFLAKKSLFNIPFLGQSMKKLGYIPIDRENLKNALAGIKQSKNLLEKSTSILIFPEGTRSPDGELLSFKRGGLNLLLRQKNITILPLVIKDSVKILKKNSMIIHMGKTVELNILKPLPVENNKFDKKKYEILIESIENVTREVLSR